MAESLTDRAEKEILRLITSGELAVGDKLSIRRLQRATQFGFMPVQDALKRLEVKGWVTIITWSRPNRGTYVSRTS